MITRATYAESRYALLSSMIDLSVSRGLELGACDLPTVKPGTGQCRYADFRSADEMVEMWDLPPSDVCRVDYVISRGAPLWQQINDRFEYVVACHVIEHVPDVINYINELRALLKPNAGNLIFLTLPDKRATSDATRPSTSLEHLIMDYHDECRYPSLEHILEFHRHWVGHERGTGPIPVAEAYPYAKTYFETGLADAHCHVWTGDEFSSQLSALIEAQFLPGLELAHFAPMTFLNEFSVVLRTTGEDAVVREPLKQ
jgi:hypothetical protein